MIVINELLCYVLHCIHSNANDNVKRIILNFYTREEIISSKRELWAKCSEVLGPFQNRKATDNRPDIVPHVDDILDAMAKLDAENKLPDFVAQNLDRVPDRQPEELNMLMLVQ